MEKGWENTKRKQQNRILDFYIQRERSIVKRIVGVPFFCMGFFFLAMRDWGRILIWILTGVFGGWGLHFICGSYVSIAHSRVGKELCKYGKLREVKKDVEEQVRRALYCSGDQAITEKYLILLSSISGRNIGGMEGFCLFSTRELEQILIEDGLAGERAEEKGYTMRFLTWEKRSFRLTVWGTYEEVCQIKKKLEECRDLGIGPARSQERDARTMIRKDKDLIGDTISDRQRILTEGGGMVQQCYRKKRRFFITIYFGIFGIFAVMIGFMVWIEWDSVQILFRSRYWNWWKVGLPVGVYFMPMLFLLIYFGWMERRVLEQYQRLNYYEQQEIDRQIAEASKTKRRSVVCGKRCFWFQDERHLGSHQLVFYKEVVWIYRSVRKIPISMQNMGASVFWLEYGVEFYTLDGKRHRLSIRNGKNFLEYFPDAIKGYGKEQKQAYREWRRKEGKKLQK